MKRAALLLAAHLVASPVAAHDWYERECCDTRDCAPVPTATIQWTEQGWVIEVPAGGHPMLRRSRRYLVPDRQTRPSRDGGWHLCIAAGVLLCTYRPQAGG